MKTKIRRILPGESFRVIAIAACIGLMAGAVGFQFGQLFRVSGIRMKVFIAAGCAGGVAAMFNVPIAGVFFAAEIVLLGTYFQASSTRWWPAE